MSLTVLDARRYGSRLPVITLPPRSLVLSLTLALGAACAKGADRPVAPLDRLHYPAWAALHDGKLLVVNDDQDLAFQGGSIVSLDPSSSANRIEAGAALPYMAGKVHVVDAAAAAGCGFFTRSATPDDPSTGFPFGKDGSSFAMVPGHSEKSLTFLALPLGGETARIDVQVPGAADPLDAAFTCSADGTARAWVSYQRGRDEKGYVGQLDLSAGYPPEVVEAYVGGGEPRSFAWDADHDRLYFTSRESKLKAPLRWIDVGSGCKPFPDGIQDEAQGGCHVDQVGYDLSAHSAGAEPNAIALSGGTQDCTTRAYQGFRCRRMYLSVRMYDADLARALGRRPAADLGGKLVVLELPESGTGAPAPQWVADYDIGKIAGEVLVLPGAGGKDIVVVTAVDDDLVWIYDDAVGAMVKVFGRLASGVPELGHMPSGLAAQDLGNGNVRVYVTMYKDHWVSAIDVPLADPGGAFVTPDPADPTHKTPLRLGSPQ